MDPYFYDARLGPTPSLNHDSDIESDEDGSDLSESDVSDEESGSDSGDDAGGLLDIEACESDGDSLEEESDGEESLLDGTKPARFWDGVAFPQFSRLPAELRESVWRFFCEEVIERPRVLDFVLAEQSSFMSRCRWQVMPGPRLQVTMQPVCAAMMVNHESRAIVLKAFPDKISIYGHQPGGNVVPFDNDTDVVSLSFRLLSGRAFARFMHPDQLADRFQDMDYSIPGFSGHVKHLALRTSELTDEGGLENAMDVGLWKFLASLPRLETVFEMSKRWAGVDRLIHWHDTSKTHVQWAGFVELDEAGIERRIPKYLVWPNTSKYRGPGNEDVVAQLDTLGDLARDFEDLAGAVDGLIPERLLKVKIWPMKQLPGRDSRRLRKLGLLDKDDMPTLLVSSDEDPPEDGWMDGSDEEEEGDDVDQDDDDREDDEDEDDSEMDDFIDDGTLEEIEFPSDALDPGPVHILDTDEVVGFCFSSPEPEPDSVNLPDEDDVRPGKRRKARHIISDDEDEDEDGDDDPRPAKRTKTKQIVISSDTEGGASVISSDKDDKPREKKTRRRPQVVESDESEDEDKKPQRQRRRPRVVESDESEDEDEQPQQQRRRPRVVDSDESEEEDVQAVDAGPSNARKRKRTARPAATSDSEDEAETSDSGSSEEDDDDDDEDDDEEEETRTRRPLTLAEKLGMHRRENPVVVSSDEEEDDEEEDDRHGRPRTLAMKLGMHRREKAVLLSSDEEEGDYDRQDDDDDEDDEDENCYGRHNGYTAESGSEDEDDGY